MRRKRYVLRKKWRMRQTVRRMPFNNAVSVNEESADVIAAYLKGADSIGLESALRCSIRCCRLRFRAAVLRLAIHLVFCGSAAARFLNAFVQIPSVPFFSSDQVPLCALENTAHSAKKLPLSFPVRARLGRDGMMKGKKRRKATENKLERSSFCRPMHLVAASVR